MKRTCLELERNPLNAWRTPAKRVVGQTRARSRVSHKVLSEQVQRHVHSRLIRCCRIATRKAERIIMLGVETLKVYVDCVVASVLTYPMMSTDSLAVIYKHLNLYCHSKINNVQTSTTSCMVLADTSDLWNAISCVKLTCHDSVGFADSFQEGGNPDGEFDTTFIRLFTAAIIEFEYIFDRMWMPTW